MVARVATVVGWCLCLAVCQVKGSYIPGEMNRTIQNLLDHYKIENKERFNGKPIFSRQLLSGNLQEDMLYMSAVLQTYDQLLNQMLKQLPTTMATPTSTEGAAAPANLRMQLSYILKKITDLRNQYYKKHEELLKKLQVLGHVQLTSQVVQSKALSELIRLYPEASSLPDRLALRRRRRQTQVKGHHRA